MASRSKIVAQLQEGLARVFRQQRAEIALAVAELLRDVLAGAVAAVHLNVTGNLRSLAAGPVGTADLIGPQLVLLRQQSQQTPQVTAQQNLRQRRPREEALHQEITDQTVKFPRFSHTEIQIIGRPLGAGGRAGDEGRQRTSPRQQGLQHGLHLAGEQDDVDQQVLHSNPVNAVIGQRVVDDQVALLHFVGRAADGVGAAAAIHIIQLNKIMPVPEGRGDRRVDIDPQIAAEIALPVVLRFAPLLLRSDVVLIEHHAVRGNDGVGVGARRVPCGGEHPSPLHQIAVQRFHSCTSFACLMASV